MKKEDCRDCVCLVEGDAGEWVCDEEGKPVEEIDICPECEREIEYTNDTRDLINLLRDNY